ncbi:hypothetical protein [Geobacillus stearothermophilus]|uniref:hypothetical protein n=1 Tax=Geobacillus stearothermophilus TaxID=1422 RepID=UPI00217D48F2|nr:hypothetical protein [Geobacillus stearothermophilus]
MLCFRAWSRDTRETRCIVKHPERKRQETPTSTPTGVSGGGSYSNQVKPQVIPNPGDGTVIGTRYYSFDNDTAKFVSSVLKTGLTAIATLAGYTFGPGAATTIASICTLAGEYINLKPYWTTVKIIRYYSDYYDQYIYDAYHFVYSDSKRTNLKKVFISDDMIKTTGNVLDTF